MQLDFVRGLAIDEDSMIGFVKISDIFVTYSEFVLKRYCLTYFKLTRWEDKQIV